MRKRLLALALVLPALGGCATKRDLKDLRAEVADLQTSQEAMLRAIQQQNESILDSLSAQEVRLRGDLTNQLVQIERQLVQIQELTGQGQQRLAELRETLREREEALRNAQASAAAPASAGDANELFETSAEAMERGSYATARAGFEEFVRAYPQDPRAAEAQLNVGVAFQQAKEPQPALEAFARVLELYPNSTQAATALYQAALIELEADNRDRARSMLNQVTAAYPRSPEANLARERLRSIR